MSAMQVNDRPSLEAALKASRTGDHIRMVAGKYAAVSLSGLVRSQRIPVVVESVDPANPAIFVEGKDSLGRWAPALQIDGSSGFMFRDFSLQVTAPDTNYYGVLTRTSRGISFDNINMRGAGSGSVSGWRTIGCQGISLSRIDAADIGYFAVFMQTSDIAVERNIAQRLGCDFCQNFEIQRISMMGNQNLSPTPISGAHPDFLQVFTKGSKIRSVGIRCVGNLLDRDAGVRSAGVQLTDEDALGFGDVDISDNTFIGGQPNGIAVFGVWNGRIANNIVTGLPLTPGDPWPTLTPLSGIKFPKGGTVTGNKTTLAGSSPMDTSNTDLPFPTDGGKVLRAGWTAKFG